MELSKNIMGMPITVEIVGKAAPEIFDKVFSYFQHIDEKFSPYKDTSEVSRFNRGEIREKELSEEMQEVLKLSQETQEQTQGYFDIKKLDGKIDPSGLVKGWAIHNASKLLEQSGLRNFYIEAGGDIQPHGLNGQKKLWSVGIKNPFNQQEIIKVVFVSGQGVATSGIYIRGQHIYNPHQRGQSLTEIVSLTVIGPNIFEADRFATAAFAMGRKGIMFIENLPGVEGYMIDKNGIATATSGFKKYA